ncbi:MAG: hypothetical protein JWL72_3576 [Ilumatobacteraceae bacterium]|nr:hypothetical protein [Ilumatobacteraceae bacterium]
MTAVRSIDVAERRARIGIRHRLAPSCRTDDVVRITDDLVALHSTDPVSVYLSAAARMIHPSLEPLAAALYEDRTLLRHHAMRRTLWVFTPEVARWAHASVTTGLLTNQRRVLLNLLRDSGTIDDPDGWLAAAKTDTFAALRRLGPTGARQLGKAVPALTTKLQLAPGKAYAAAVAAHTRVLLLLGFEGAIVRTRPTGTWINGEYAWAVADDWIDGGLTGADPAASAAALAGRWLATFGPAPAADLQWWTGWNGRVTAAALAGAGAVEVDLGGERAWVAADDLEPVADLGPWVALLPSLDPTTMGWKQRQWFISPGVTAAIFDRNGNGGPTIWVDGEVVGSWVQRPNGEIAIGLVSDVGAEQRAAIDDVAERLRGVLGAARFKARFPAPIQTELLRA